MKTPVLLAVTLAAFGVSLAAAEGPTCPSPQSPRNVNPRSRPSPYFLTSNNSIVSDATPESLVYLPRSGGPGQKLLRCGQHYHYPIENPQGCPRDVVSSKSAVSAEAGPVKPGDWIEIHTVYAAKVRSGNCDPETLDCCEEGPFLVWAFEAKVTKDGRGGPIVPPSGRPLAEWTGSTTGREDKPGECKPEALWSFRLGCDFRVSEAQVRAFHHHDPARPLQPADRVSRDLTLVGAKP
ncbi:MAG TPA: hypothetical protein VFR03_07670 [Thermoanaerobaculia bacterium]|nr:hypothetical protein [Thermoanaerobaculia bacterium]